MGPLIFDASVEMHRADWVLRQFGMVQNIPNDPHPDDDSLHATMQKLRSSGQRVHKLQCHIAKWHNAPAYCATHWVSEFGIPTVEPGYDAWYCRVTRLLITPPRVEVDVGFEPGLIHSTCQKVFKSINYFCYQI